MTYRIGTLQPLHQMYQEKIITYGLPFQIRLMSFLFPILNKTREDFSLYVFAQISFAKMALKKVFNTSRILAGFVVKLDDIFCIQSTCKLKTILISPETKHRHLNFILVSMNKCAHTRFEIEGLYFNVFISVSELLISTDKKIWYIDFFNFQVKTYRCSPTGKKQCLFQIVPHW